MSKNLASSTKTPPLRSAALRGAVAVAILGLGYGTVRGLEAMLNAVFDKPPAPLSKPLPEMKSDLGRYVADGPDEVLDPEMQESLGTSDYLVRRFRDRDTGQLVNLNVNYYATGTSTPHVPEICWKGAGMIEATASRKTFTVDGLKRTDGHGQLSDITMRLISFMPQGSQKSTNDRGEPIYSNVAYVFQVNGMYVAGTQEVTSLFWKASYRYAYHAKIEITPLDTTDPRHGILLCTQADAERIVKNFIRVALPEVEACLPDPSILTAGAADTSKK